MFRVYNRLTVSTVVRRNVRHLVTIGDESAYEALQKSNQKKIYYFTATWCPPVVLLCAFSFIYGQFILQCKRIAPIFESLSKEHSSISFNKLDIDLLPDAAEEHGIASVPTFIFFNGDQKLDQVGQLQLYNIFYNGNVSYQFVMCTVYPMSKLLGFLLCL